MNKLKVPTTRLQLAITQHFKYTFLRKLVLNEGIY